MELKQIKIKCTCGAEAVLDQIGTHESFKGTCPACGQALYTSLKTFREAKTQEKR